MGLLNRFLTSVRAHQPPAVQSLRDSIAKLRIAIFARLLLKYADREEVERKFLAAAVFNEAILEPPGNKEAERYLARNRDLVTTEALKLTEDQELAEALSYLYAAQVLFYVYLTQRPVSEESMSLAERASELGLYVPSVVRRK
jgi:hypothetical protein